MIQLFPIGVTSAIQYALRLLVDADIEIVDHPTPEVTHLLLDIPSFLGNGGLRSGGTLEKILETIPQYITVIGGNLEHAALEGYRKWDFLRDDEYLCQNAAITAECALQVAAPLLTTTFAQAPALIIGWGRIGKCLGMLLKEMGCQVTVAARKSGDRAMLRALGYHAADPMDLGNLSRYRMLFNTAPSLVMTETQLSQTGSCVKIDLASRKGLEGEDVIWARGLPGVYAPESSGRLIAETILRKLKEEKG